nr:partner and localizer of BRCA2 isoform X1 [Paramormyrops kingsleyae]
MTVLFVNNFIPPCDRPRDTPHPEFRSTRTLPQLWDRMHNIQASMEDSVNTLLHGDDTEMLREKLALLRREYNRTVQRLRRAERSELVRKHVRSRIAEQNRSEVEQSTVTSSDLSVSKVETLASVTPSDSDVYCRGMAVRFSLPPETYSLCTRPGDLPGSAPLSDNHAVDQAGSPTSGRGHRRHSAHRLRSRRSWLRWEQKERSDSQRSESGESSTGQGDGEKMDSLLVPVLAEDCQPEVLSCSKEAGFQGPSAQEKCRGREEGLDKPFDRSVSTQGSLKDNNSVEKCESLADSLLGETMLSETPEIDFSTTKPLSVPSPSRPSDGNPTSDEAGEQRGSSPPPPASDSGEVGCLDSCTMIEGLLFPVEYYVRTTRRMASAQSHVDLGAVIQSQLSHGRKGRGRRRRPAGGVTRDSQTSEVTLQPQALGAEGEDESQVPPEPKSCQNHDTDCAVSRRYAGRRQKGGGAGRGRGRAARKHFSPPTKVGTTGPDIAADLISHTGNDVQTAEKELYAIFRTNGRAKMSGFNIGEDSLQRGQTGTDLCDSLLLQPPGPVQQPLRPTVPPSGGGNFNLRALLSRFDVKDFHLPDDEFGRLKLDKLRSSATASLDASLPRQSPYNTRRGASRTPLGADRHKSAGSSGGPVGSLAGTNCQQHIQVLPNDAPPQLPKELRSRNSTAQQTATATMRSFRVRLPGGKQGRNNFSEDGEDGRVPSPESRSSQLNPVVRNSPGSSLGVRMGEGDRGGVANCMEVEGGVEASPAGMALSPCVLNFSSSTPAHNEKSERPVLPLLGSPTFPSLGVTPAFSAHSSLPSQNCSASTPLKVQSPVARQATPSTSRDSQRHRAASSGGTPPSLLCQSPEELIQSRNPLPAEVVQQKVHAIEVSANQSYSPKTLLPCFSDSLSSSILASITSQCRQSAPSPSLDRSDIDSSPPFGAGEDPYTPTPQTTLKDGSAPMKGHVGKSPLAETPSGVDLAPSLSPGSSQKGDNVESLNPSGAVLLSPSQDCPEAGEGEAPCLVNADGSMGGASRDSHSDVEPLLQAASVDKCSLGEQSLSPGTEAADQDLDSYFTDSVWPPWGQASSSQGPLGRQAETQGMAPPTERRSPAADILQLMHTLKAPAGRCLVDVWGVRMEMGWSVVTAEEWAVSLWQQTSPEQWCLLHTWPFTEHPVIALLPVPDAPGLVCAALGQLEIREARILSFVNAGGPFSQSVLCTGEIQAVLGVSEGRLVCCASSGSTQTVTVAQLTKDGRPQKSLSLVSPGQGVHALAPVEGEPDALIGSTDAGHLLLWNMRTGNLLQSFALGECLLGATCLRGYSEGGVLFMLLQHKFLSQEDGVLFSLIATNPITARYVLAHSLIQPALCLGRFTDVDVCGSSLAVAFQCGTLATWDLRQWDLLARLARAPEEGCNVVRWAGPSSLLIGNLSGDVSLYQYTGGHCAAKPE